MRPWHSRGTVPLGAWSSNWPSVHLPTDPQTRLTEDDGAVASNWLASPSHTDQAVQANTGLPGALLYAPAGQPSQALVVLLMCSPGPHRTSVVVVLEVVVDEVVVDEVVEVLEVVVVDVVEAQRPSS